MSTHSIYIGSILVMSSRTWRPKRGLDRRGPSKQIGARDLGGPTDSEPEPFCGSQGRRHSDVQTGLNLDPFMIHETFLSVAESAFGSHPCRVVSVTYRKLRPFHGANAGSNPAGDANSMA